VKPYFWSVIQNEGWWQMSAKRSRTPFQIAFAVLLLGNFQIAAFALSGVMIAGQQAFNPYSQEKSTTIQKNIDNALVASPNKGPSAVGVVHVKGQPVITLGGFYVCSVDAASARAAKITPNLLAQRWANGLRGTLKNQAQVNSYIAKLTNTNKVTVEPGTTTTQSGSYPFYRKGKAVYIPAGMTIPVTLRQGLSSEYARPGDIIEATIAEDVNLGDTSIPQNSEVLGQVTSASPGARMSHTGILGLKFNKIRTPDGLETPIEAHIIGGIAKHQVGSPDSNVYVGEGTSGKIKNAALHGAIGAGAGALAGTAIGAIASHGYGTGRGALAGMTIGGALGVAESLLLRKGANVHIASGNVLKLQLDAPATIASN
jgi:hypothetical protein